MAAGLAAELLESHQINAELIVGTKGIFDVKVDNDLVFSKFSLERFPFLGEVSKLLKDRQG